MEQIAATIVRERAASGYLLDPHTRCRDVVRRHDAPSRPMIVLGHCPSGEIPRCGRSGAAGVRPHLPARLAGIMEKPKKV